jgi:hypothetical protein
MVRRAHLHALAVVAAVLCAIGLGVLWHTSDGQVAARAHDAALATWQSKEPAAYSFTYRHCGGMCGDCPIRVTVRDGTVADATRGPDICSGDPEGVTVEELFEIESRARSGWFDNSSAKASYDPEWGFPTFIRTTCDPGWSDCGSSWSVSDFEVLDPRG